MAVLLQPPSPSLTEALILVLRRGQLALDHGEITRHLGGMEQHWVGMRDVSAV